MDDYLKGFNDGYNKAVELHKNQTVNITIDDKKIAETIYPHVKELQEIENNVKQRFT